MYIQRREKQARDEETRRRGVWRGETFWGEGIEIEIKVKVKGLRKKQKTRKYRRTNVGVTKTLEDYSVYIECVRIRVNNTINEYEVLREFMYDTTHTFQRPSKHILVQQYIHMAC